MRPLHRLLSFVVCCASFTAHAQTPVSPRIDKIDPPNWYATLPKPMLLVRGVGLGGAQFTLSDPALAIDHTVFSDNGHYAQLWLSASPAAPETVKITAERDGQRVSAPYRFDAPRPAGSVATGFSPRDVIYLIMTDRFADGDHHNDGPDAKSDVNSPAALAQRANPKGWHGGDLRGIDEHIEYLQSLGITAVWPTPVYQNHGPEAYHGYHATDYYAVDEHYGTLPELKKLTDDLHAHGMKLLLDTVPNHVGPFHPWVTDEPAPNWFHGTAANHIEAQYDFYALINPHSSARDRDATLHGWFVNLLPDMNTDDPTVSLYLRQNTIWWLEETGADGLRIDTFPYVDRKFWHDFHTELYSLFPNLTEVGEVSNGDPEVTSAFAADAPRNGANNQPDTGLYTPFDFPMYHASRAVFSGKEPLSRLAFILSQDELYPHPERLVPFLGNHDESRFAGAVTDPVERQLAWAFLMTTRGTPQIYSGDEISMPGGDDPDDRRDFPGGFPISKSDPAANGPAGTPTNDAFKLKDRTAEQALTFDQIANLAKLRRSEPALSCGAEQVLVAKDDTLVYARYGTSGCTGAQLAAVTPGENATPALGANSGRPVLVFLQRKSMAPITTDLAQTAVAGCKAGAPLLGSATVQLTSTSLSVTPQTPVVILPCN